MNQVETITSDEYQVVEFGPRGGEIGPVSSGHFLIDGIYLDEDSARKKAIQYAKKAQELVGNLASYQVRRVTISTVVF